jgi:membrane protein DedA with SNARE-associated domain
MLQEWLTHIVVNYPILVYGVIILISSVEGPIVALLAGVFLRIGYLDLIPVYFALMIGDLIGDCWWYYVGRRWGHRFVELYGKYFSVREKNIHKVTKIFHKYKNSILLISKLTAGLGFAVATLITAGMVGIPFKRYITLNIMGQFIWTALLLSVGYLFSHLYVTFNNFFSRMSLIACAIVVLFAVFGFGKFIRKHYTED